MVGGKKEKTLQLVIVSDELVANGGLRSLSWENNSL